MALLGVQPIAADHSYIREEFSFPGPFAPGKPLLLRARAVLLRSVSQMLRRHSQQTGVQMSLEHAGERSCHSLTSSFVRGHGINRSAGDGFVTQRLLDDRKIDVSFDQRDAEAVFQAVKMPLIFGQSSTFSDISKNAM